MLRRKNNRAQSLWEYTMLFSLIMAFMIAMGTYFRRGVQARIRSAIVYAARNEVLRQTGGNFIGNLYYGYEPYFLTSDANVVSVANMTTTLSGAWGTSGIYRAQMNEQRGITSTTITAPPRSGN